MSQVEYVVAGGMWLVKEKSWACIEGSRLQIKGHIGEWLRIEREIRFILGCPNVASSKEGILRSIQSDGPKLTRPVEDHELPTPV